MQIVSSVALGITLTLSANAAPKKLESVAAIVNNNVILESEVNNMLQSVKSSTDPKNLPNDATLKHQIIERLIVENLILQQAQRLKINVTDDELTTAIKKIATENNMSIDEMRSYLASLGVSYNTYRDRIRNEMLIEQTRMNEVRKRITISENEVQNLANTIATQPMNNREVNISHILISIPENATKQQIDNAGEKAKTIIQNLHNGESFEKLAATYSNDENALKGGKMGWFRLNELPTLFEERLVRSQKNDIIGPLRSGAGYHILKVNDTRTEKAKTVKVQEVNARHILIKTNVLVSDEAAKAKLQEIRQSIKEGSTTFENAAKTYSEDLGSAENGGELGWSDPDRYDPNFKKGLLKLKKGELSQPIKSAFGWHLIELIDTRNVDKTEYAQKDQAYRLIFNRKFSEELQIWIQELKGDAYIKIMGEDN
ncbi:peptidylprolyl isomerase SurA [Orbaceae bacterium ac157xtp]